MDQAILQPFVEGRLNYADPAFTDPLLYDHGHTNLELDTRVMPIHDGRAAGAAFSIERNGFRLVRSPVDLSFGDLGQAVAHAYRHHTRMLVKALTHASRALVINEIVRRENEPGADQPYFHVHVDSDLDSVRAGVRSVHPDADALLEKRFALINVWRPMAPVERTPLAVCDASTVRREDLVGGHVDTGQADPDRLQTVTAYALTYSPRHRWWYFPQMRPDEALVFKLADSDPDAVQFTAHAAFDDPRSPADAQPRQSIETRVVAFFD